MSAAVTKFFTKALSPSYYSNTARSLLDKSYDYYHPMFRAGSATPLWHCMIAISVIMYTTSYYARDYPRIQAKHAVEKEALKEYYAKHGGGDDHH